MGALLFSLQEAIRRQREVLPGEERRRRDEARVCISRIILLIFISFTIFSEMEERT